MLRSLAGKPILNGRDSVRQVLDMMRSQGGRMAEIANSYHGLVIENFDCDKSIYTAVEVTAGNRMFHHIVESDRVGTEILKLMNQEKLPGEVKIIFSFLYIVKKLLYLLGNIYAIESSECSRDQLPSNGGCFANGHQIAIFRSFRQSYALHIWEDNDLS